MKNKMMWKLVSCFGLVLLLFSLVTDGLFLFLFRQYIVKLYQADMEHQATSIAGLYANMQLYKEEKDHISHLDFMQFLDDITSSDSWIVSSDHKLITHNGYQFEELPDSIKNIIEQVLDGKTAYTEEFSDYLKTSVVTVGVPIYNTDKTVFGAVLLHSPVDGIDSAVSQGLSILVVSVLVSLLIVAAISVLLSYQITRPVAKIKLTAQRLADHDYTAKTGIKQQDEIGQLAVVMDLLSERLEEASNESLRLEEMGRDFIMNVSHELRTPVTVLRGSLEALRDKIVTNPEQIEQYQDQMLTESVYLERLVNDLLELFRLQNSDFHIEMSPINLSDIISDVVRGMRRVAQKKDITIVTKLAITQCWVNGDYGRIRQMLLIVLDNAIKFSYNGQQVNVILESESQTAATLCIQDSGRGISKEDLPIIFDRLHKEETEANRMGTGLGLSIAKQIARRHGIEIMVTSEKNSNTEFKFHFVNIGMKPENGS